MVSDSQRMVEPGPSPWTESGKPALQSPFVRSMSHSPNRGRSDSDCLGGSESSISPYTSTTTSPTCSPHSSPTGEPRNHKHRFTQFYHRTGNSFSVLSSRVRRFPSPSFFLRRRPSSVDLALSEERSRCTEDSVERVGLGLMEPRPVDPMPTVVDLPPKGTTYCSLDGAVEMKNSGGFSDDLPGVHHRPRYVMGGIIEVMEGRA